MIYVVLGMHKSGTTLLSQILHHSGINMGDFDEGISYDRGNKYERQTVLNLDMRILGTTDFGVLDLHSSRRPDLSEGVWTEMRKIIADGEALGGDWGFKDPRNVLVYDLWKKELPEHRIIATYREPSEVWPRFKWGFKRSYRNFRRADEYLTIWQDHNLNLINILEKSTSDYLLLSYRDLMTDDRAFEKLQEFVGRDLEDRRRSGLYRSKAGGDVFLHLANQWMGRRDGVTWQKTMARLDELKTPLEE